MAESKHTVGIEIRGDASGGRIALQQAADATRDLAQAASQATPEMAELGQAAGQAGDGASQAAGGVDGLVGRFGKLTAVAGTVVAALGVVAAKAMQWAAASAEADRAQVLLENNLANTTGATDAQVAALTDLAAARQKATGYDADATVAAQAYLATFGLTAEAIGVLTPRLLDVAENQRRLGETSVDLTGIAAQLGKAYAEDSAAGLREYGVTLTAAQEAQLAAATGMEKVAVLAQVLDANFAGAADAVGATYEGALRRATAAAGDLQESLGGLALSTGAPQDAVATYTTLAEAIARLADALAAQGPPLSAWTVGMEAGGRAMQIAEGAMNPMLAATDALSAGLARQGVTIESTSTALADWINRLKDIDPNAQAAAAATADYADSTRDATSAIGPLTEQQAMLLEQSGGMIEALAAESQAHQQAAAAADRHRAALSGIEEAARVLGASRAELETGTSDQDRAILAAFDDIRTSAAATGQSIERALGLAIGKISGEQLPLLAAAWDQAFAEAQIGQDTYDRGVSAILDGLDGFAQRQPTIGALATGLRSVGEAAQGAASAIAGIGAQGGALSSTADRVSVLGAALAQFRAGKISAEQLGDVQRGVTASAQGKGSASRGQADQATPVQLAIDQASVAAVQQLRAQIAAPIVVPVTAQVTQTPTRTAGMGSDLPAGATLPDGSPLPAAPMDPEREASRAGRQR